MFKPHYTSSPQNNKLLPWSACAIPNRDTKVNLMSPTVLGEELAPIVGGAVMLLSLLGNQQLGEGEQGHCQRVTRHPVIPIARGRQLSPERRRGNQSTSPIPLTSVNPASIQTNARVSSRSKGINTRKQSRYEPHLLSSPLQSHTISYEDLL